MPRSMAFPPGLLSPAFGHLGANVRHSAGAGGLRLVPASKLGSVAMQSTKFHHLLSGHGESERRCPARHLCDPVSQLPLFWGINMWVIYRGIDTIRLLLNIKAPLLLALGLILLWWAWRTAGGFGEMFSQPSAFDAGQPKAGQFWNLLFPRTHRHGRLLGHASLNIPDFSRYAKSQRDQMLGQRSACPTTMALHCSSAGRHFRHHNHLPTRRCGIPWTC